MLNKNVLDGWTDGWMGDWVVTARGCVVSLGSNENVLKFILIDVNICEYNKNIKLYILNR